MSSIAISVVSFALIFGAALAAMVFRRRLPEEHLSADSKEVLKIGMGLIASLAALVLGLLIATAKGTFDNQANSVRELAAKVIILEEVLAKYGPETAEIRGMLRKAMTATEEHLWPEDGKAPSLALGEARSVLEAMYDRIGALAPQTDAQRGLKSKAQDGLVDLGSARIRLFSQRDGSLPGPLIVVLVFWLVILFFGYGLLAPGNATVVTMLFVCALSVSGAVFLLLELTSPFNGIMRVSSKPLKDALALLGQ